MDRDLIRTASRTAWTSWTSRIQYSVRDSRTSGLCAQSHAFIKMVDQARIDLFHEMKNFGQEILNFSDITLKEKQYEVLKLLVFEKKHVLAIYILPTGNDLLASATSGFHQCAIF